MRIERLAVVLLGGAVLLAAGPVLAASGRAPQATDVQGQPAGHAATGKAGSPPPKPPPAVRPPAPFVPIVNGQLIAYYRHYPPSYSDQFLEAYGLLPPFGAYVYGPRSGYDPQLFQAENYPLQRSTATPSRTTTASRAITREPRMATRA
jgi:hypothetical protein